MIIYFGMDNLIAVIY